MKLIAYAGLFLLLAGAAWAGEPPAKPPVVSQPAVSDAERSKPNIILVFIDDMGWADFSCFGNRDADTPQIDVMASEGIAFEQFYVNSPVCSPSRVAISTGTYPQRWQINSFLAGRASNQARGMAQWLDPKAPMLARSLKEAGYATGHFGKWHMGGQRDVTDAPAITEYGFDESLTNFEGMGAKLLPLTKTPNGKVGKIWQDAERLGKPVTWMQRSEITGGFVDASIAFMDKAQQNGKPFYINVWPDDVHTPLWPLVKSWGDGSKRAKYLGVLEGMDTQLGKLFAYIKDRKELRDNTLILICSDNGPEPGAGQAAPFKGFKWQLYEGGIRSPLVVWGPGVMEDSGMGTRNTESVFSAIDLVPSLLRLGGARKPAGAEYDGEDLLDTLLGKATRSRTNPIFFGRPAGFKKMPMPGFEEQLPDLAVRHGKWKLLCDYDGSRPQLYDLSTDPGEAKNLVGSQPKVARELVDQVVTWHKTAINPKESSPAKAVAEPADKSNQAGSKLIYRPEMSSRWQEELLSATPLPEYPRPTLVRKEWLNLNGQWDFLPNGPKPPQLPTSFADTAHVPSALQGITACVKKGGDYGWYRKSITIPQEWAGRKVLLHCEAIGTKSRIYFDGQELGSHVGGFKRVSHELPGCTAGQEHEIVVYFDDTDVRMPRGKPGALAGIWQTVWMEPVANDYIVSCRQTPDIDSSSLVLEVDATDPAMTVTATAFDQDKPVATAEGQAGQSFNLNIPNQKLWSPEDPFLYDLVLELKKDGKTTDRVEGYFGMRKISTGEVGGEPRIFLNNEVYYQIGLLDQGTWPDSYYTQPSDKCLEFEIQTAKDMGFNVIRKHFKIECERWYNWCDKIGMLVWQDAPRQLRYVRDLHENDAAKQLQRDLVRDMVTQLYNHPSIITWVLFNEGGSQFDPRAMTVMTRRLDTSRLINATSHVNHDQVKNGRTRYNVDFYDAHCYDRTLKFEDYNCHIPATFGEYGGIGYEIKGHSVQRKQKNWGYGPMVSSEDALLSEYEKLVRQAVAMRTTDNLCAVIYTELTDFHNEVNGFITWDRKVVKVDPERLSKVNALFREVEPSAN